jgi:hypothetical protein
MIEPLLEDGDAELLDAVWDSLPPHPDTPREPRLSQGGFWRPLTGPEQRADMSAQRDALDGLTRDLGAALTVQVRELIQWLRKDIVRRGLAQPDTDPALVRSIEIPGVRVADLRKVIEPHLMAAYTAAGTHATRELAAAEERSSVKLAAKKRPGLVGTKVGKFFRAKAFTITDLIVEPILAKAKLVLYNAIKGDNPERVTLANLDEVLNEWLPVENRGGQEVNVPARIENIARTNIGEAWSEARYAAFTDPDLPEGFVDLMQMSAILDDRVRESHAAWDGVVKPTGWWLGPPDRRPLLGYQCRCQLLPVFPWDGFEETPDEALPREVIPDIGFK